MSTQECTHDIATLCHSCFIEDSFNVHLPEDVINYIFDCVTDDATYKAILQVSRSVNKKQTLHKSKHFNQLWTLINKYPTMKWDWYVIISNPNTTESKIEYAMTCAPDVKNKGMGGWSYAACNPNATFDFLKKNTTLDDWADVAGESPHIFDIVSENPDYDWDGEVLSDNPRLTMKFVKNILKLNGPPHFLRVKK